MACAMLACLAGRALGQASLPVDPGETVHTFEALNDLPGGTPVVTLVDTTPPSLAGATLGTNYTPPIFWNASGGPNAWTVTNLGQVYGVCLDDAPKPNIYVTAASSPYIYGASELPNAFGPLGSGGVYRLDGRTGDICQLSALPNTGNAGLGNITYSPAHNSLYVSNFDDGLIYRISLGASSIANNCSSLFGGTFDHGVTGRLAQGLTSMPDDALPGITKYGRRVWGLAVNPSENRLYYGVWWEDSGRPNPTENNEVWSVLLNAIGDPTTSARREFTLPNLPNLGFSNPAAGIHFGANAHMFVGERSVDGPHHSQLLEYSGGTAAWIAAPANKYQIGLNGTSCSGACATDLQGNVWTAGDALILNGTIADYGMMRIRSGGNTADVPNYSQSILIDSDQDVTSGGDKTQIGSLAHRPMTCAPPPAGLTSWLTFDDQNVDNLLDVVNPSSPLGGYWDQPSVVQGMVGLARCYNGTSQYSFMPSSPANNVGAGDFTIDAWIKWQGGAGVRKIVDKRVLTGNTAIGYAFFVQPGAGNLFLSIGNGIGGQNVGSGLAIPLNQWVFVSVSVSRPSAALQRATFCVGNPATGVFQTSAPGIINSNIFGTLDNTEPLTIGVRSARAGGGAYFDGCIDEVEIFQRALLTSELRRIFDAGPLGKCHVSCTLPPWTFFTRIIPGGTFPPFVFANATQATIRNYDRAAPQLHTFAFAPFPVTVLGPSSFQPNPASSLLVPSPGVAALTQLRLGKPTNMSAAGDTGGYVMVVNSPVPGRAGCSCEGQVVARSDYLWHVPTDPVRPVGRIPTPIAPFGFTNGDTTTFDRHWEVLMVGPDGQPDTRDVSINGMAPGETLEGRFTVPPGESFQFPDVTIQFRNPSPNVPYYLLVRSRPPASHDYSPLEYIPVESLLEEPPCRADYNHDGVVDFFDYLDFAAAFDAEDPAADFNGDQVVDFFDYLDFAAAFDAGCE